MATSAHGRCFYRAAAVAVPPRAAHRRRRRAERRARPRPVLRVSPMQRITDPAPSAAAAPSTRRHLLEPMPLRCDRIVRKQHA